MADKLLNERWLMLTYLLNIDECHTFLTQELPITLYELLEYPLDFEMMNEEVFFTHVHILSQSQYAS